MSTNGTIPYNHVVVFTRVKPWIHAKWNYCMLTRRDKICRQLFQKMQLKSHIALSLIRGKDCHSGFENNKYPCWHLSEQ